MSEITVVVKREAEGYEVIITEQDGEFARCWAKDLDVALAMAVPYMTFAALMRDRVKP